MPRITSDTRLERVEHVVGSGSGVLEFAVADEQSPYIWDGHEDAEWSVMDAASVENDTEDRFIIFPEAEFFTCEIGATGEEFNDGPVRCWCE